MGRTKKSTPKHQQACNNSGGVVTRARLRKAKNTVENNESNAKYELYDAIGKRNKRKTRGSFAKNYSKDKKLDDNCNNENANQLDTESSDPRVDYNDKETSKEDNEKLKIGICTVTNPSASEISTEQEFHVLRVTEKPGEYFGALYPAKSYPTVELPEKYKNKDVKGFKSLANQTYSQSAREEPNLIAAPEVVSESKGSKQKMKSKKSVPISLKSIPVEESSSIRRTRSRLTCFKCNAAFTSELLLDSHKVSVHKMTANTKCKGEKSSSQNIVNNINNQTKNSQPSCQKITGTHSQSSRRKPSRILLGKRSTKENKATELSCTVNKMPFIEADKDSSLTKGVSNLSGTIVPVTNVSAACNRSAQNVEKPNLLRNGRKRNSCCNDDNCVSFKRKALELTPESETQRDVSSFSVETSEKSLQSSVEIIVEDVIKSQNASLILKKYKVERVFSQNTNVTDSFLNHEKSNHDPKTVPNSKDFCDTAASGEDIRKAVAQQRDKTITYSKRLPNSKDDCDKVLDLTSSSDEEITQVHPGSVDESNLDHLNVPCSIDDSNTTLAEETRPCHEEITKVLIQSLDESNNALLVKESVDSLRTETPVCDEEIDKFPICLVMQFSYGVPIIEGAKEQLSSAIQSAASASSIHCSDSSFSSVSGRSVNLSPSTPTHFQREDLATIYDQECTRNVSMRVPTIPQFMEEFEGLAENTTSSADQTQFSAPAVVQGTQIADETQSSAPSEVQGTQIADETLSSAPYAVQGTQIADETLSSAPSEVQGTQIADETQSSAPYAVQGTQIADETLSSAPPEVQWTQIIDETQSAAPSEVQGTQIADETLSSAPPEVQWTQIIDETQSAAPSEVQWTQIIDETQSAAPSEVQWTQIIDETQSAAPSEVQWTQIIDETQSAAPEVQWIQIIDETQCAAHYEVKGTQIIDETQSAAPSEVQGTQIIDETQSAAPSEVQGTQIIDETQCAAPEVQWTQIIDETQCAAPEVQWTQIIDETQSSAPEVQWIQIIDETQSSAPEVQWIQIIDETQSSAPSEVQGTQIIDETQSAAPSEVQWTQIIDETQSAAPSEVQWTQIIDETQSAAPSEVQWTQIIDETQSAAPEVQWTQIIDETQSSASAEVQVIQLAENEDRIEFIYNYSGMSNSIGTEQSCFSSSQLLFTSVANQDKTELPEISEENFLENGVLNFSEEELFNSVNNLNQLMITPEKNEVGSCRTLNTPTFEMSGGFSSP